MADKMPGGTIYEKGATGYFTEDQAVNLEAIHRQLGAQAAAAMEQAKRPQFADNGDGTITLTTSTTITDAGDGTLTIGA